VKKVPREKRVNLVYQAFLGLVYQDFQASKEKLGMM